VAHAAEELGRVGFLGHLAGVHDNGAVGTPGDHAHVVGDEQDAHVQPLTQLVDEVEDLGLDGDVEGGGGLVGDQQLGSHASAMAIMTRWRRPPESSWGTDRGALRGGHLDEAEDLERPVPRLLAAGVAV